MPMSNPSWERLLQYFEYQHLPSHLQAIAQPFHTLAQAMTTMLDATHDPAEVSVGLRKLLEAKDAFVRAGLQ